jgi:hypothetical protein
VVQVFINDEKARILFEKKAKEESGKGVRK